jgi:hypothetical protein
MTSRGALALAVVAALGASAGCARRERAFGPDDAPALALDGWTPGRHTRPPSPQTPVPFSTARASLAPGTACLVSLRSTVLYGSFELRVLDESTRPLARRRVNRLGDNLDLLAVAAPPDGRLFVELIQPARSGPLDVELGALAIHAVSPDTAAPVAAELARQFEIETGRLAAPVEANLVPNADFSEDDEVRGTPADWSAYVAAEVDAGMHVLRAEGTPFGERPYLATGPVVVRPGARYLALCRLRVREGTVVFRIVDYDEVADLGVAPEVSAEDGAVERVLEFTPGTARAVRLWLAPGASGSAAAFELHAIQLERLPENAS